MAGAAAWGLRLGLAGAEELWDVIFDYRVLMGLGLSLLNLQVMRMRGDKNEKSFEATSATRN